MFHFPTRIPRLRIGLRIQIGLLGISGVLLTGAICLIGINLAADAQVESDHSVNLRQHVAGLSANYLEAGQIAIEFLRKHDEKQIDRHSGVLDNALEHVSAVENSSISSRTATRSNRTARCAQV